MYTFDILENNLGEAVCTGTKVLYNTDNQKPLNRWLKDSMKGLKTFDAPQMSSAVTIKPKGYGKLTKNALAYIVCSQNTPRANAQGQTILSSAFSSKNGISVTDGNYFQCVVHFASRRLITGNWKNWYDEYLTPNENDVLFETFKNDSIVYSLFESKSGQSSLRQITYKGEIWDIKNQFFWMSKEEMTNLANNGNYPELYNDARTDSDRYVYKILFGEQRIYDQLSAEAKDVLDSASNLVRLSFGMRRNFADDTNHLNSWDAGYAQLKLLWKEYYPEQFKEFRDKYKVLEDKMRPMVYELGFLIK